METYNNNYKTFRGDLQQQLQNTVWRLTTHIIEMKIRGVYQNKIVEHVVKLSIEKATLILHTHVTHVIDDLNEIGHACMVQN